MAQHILGPEWNLSPGGINMVTDDGAIKDPKIVLKNALDSDLKIIGRGALASQLSKGQLGKIVLQIQKIRNVSAPKAKEESQAAPRMLKLTLTDGESYIQAIEGAQINTISREKIAPGTKVVLNDVRFVSGFLMINPQNFTVLGGQVEHLYDKWLLAKSVQQNHQHASNDGAPSWVPFGKRIVTGNSDGSFKSLQKGKDETGDSEFDQQRKEAIAEVSTGAVKKTFGGRVKQNVQPVQNNQTFGRGRFNDKGDNDRTNRRGKFSSRDEDVSEKFQKPSEKVSLFSFLEDKLPVSEIKKPTAQLPSCNQNICNDYHQKDPRIQQKRNQLNSNNATRRFEQKNIPPLYKGQSQKPNTSNNEIAISADRNSANAKKTANSGENNYRNTQHKYPKDKVNGASEPASQYQQKTSTIDSTQQFSSYSQRSQYPSNDRSYQRDNLPQYRSNNDKYLHQQNHPPSNTQGYYSNHTRQHYQNPNANHYSQHQQNNDKGQANNQQNGLHSVVQNAEMHQLANNLSKISVSNEFASRSLRQHLNLGPSKKLDAPPQSNESSSGSMTINIGDQCMAKYWEDGKFYPAVVSAITDKTYAVQFKGYGNIEEVLKNDCFSATHLHTTDTHNPQNRANNHNGYHPNNFTGTMEFRSRRGPPRN